MPEPLLLHICCAPCGGGCVAPLLDGGRTPRLFYSNSNLCDEAEFLRRLQSVRALSAHYKIELEVDDYDHAGWLGAVKGFESEPEGGARCRRCFAWSLACAARRAGELGVNFATTLTVSPHKSSRLLFEVGGVYENFEPHDFKKRDGFLRGVRLAVELGFYRQNFCGCEFSKRTQASSSAPNCAGESSSTGKL